MKSKEALISLNERFGTGKYAWGFNIEKELKIINQDLDRLEKLQKVIEIAKHRCINFQVVMGSSYELYVDFCKVGEVGENAIPTREEYELVKEVLDNE